MDRARFGEPSLAAPGALLTDLYELTMLRGYHARGMNGTASFELFVRRLPPGRNFLVAAGLAQALEYLAALRFERDEVEWLAARGFPRDFLDFLAGLRFTGDVDALPEGTACFADEPILRVTAPLAEAQLVESRLINLVHYQTLVASKAARMVLAAQGRKLVDFGMRRAHGAEAGLLSARAAWLAGFDGTATVEAARRFGIPVVGTMAHSYVQAHSTEAEAFESFALAQRGDPVVLLIDTYDTEVAARKVVALAPRLAERGAPVRAVRIDSGDLGEHARRVRAILDAGGLAEVTIFASGGLDEHEVARLVAQRAPIDGFGVGTSLNTSADAPALDCAYKLQAYDGQPRRKRSEGKATWPGRKQVLRRYGADGRIEADLLALMEERAAGEPLLVPAMRGGVSLAVPGLEAGRAHAARELSRLPEALRALDPAPPFAPAISPAVRGLADALDRLPH